VITLTVVLGSLYITSRQLPEQVASHFSGGGAPDGWMSRGAYLWTMAGLAAGLSGVLVGAFYACRFFPQSMINLPQKAYWLAPERRADTFDALFRAGVWLAVFHSVFLLAVHLLVVAANAAQPVRLSSLIWALLGGFLAVIAVWGCLLVRRFKRVE
jgi:serine/threonine-protein kinase